MIKRVCLHIAPGQWQDAKDVFERGEHGSVIVDGMVNGGSGDQRRDDDSRHAHSQLCKVEAVATVFWIGRCITGSDGLWRRYVVIKSAVFVVGDDQDAAFPVRRTAYSFVDLLNQGLATRDIIFGML